ncbi:uncharacterized protein N7479_010318 [Penicillium vulpinum]|uniref:Uncharacterized protein n=1 Tax=Penicillium vulpinum TaxID=29845 RepID=A0A1V6S8V6_9EURO|nr:uncharacterized protein N7479_010318 [Penicillium vulpinum]KAJ5951905.1 hypothetical protein N7479_010318 [Penicillium vulpinum]OQE10482.1 hypothetical protein PENVUL_c004G06054 [Penicillium vulpinum]
MTSRAHSTAGFEISLAPPPNPPHPHLKIEIDSDARIYPFWSCDGEEHQDFPKTIKQYYELDSDKLDSLMVFFEQFLPRATETTSYPRIADTWLKWDYKESRWLQRTIDIETKRCIFGVFIGLTGELVDPSLPNPRRYHASLDKPAQKPKPPPKPSGIAPSNAGIVHAQSRDKPKKGFWALFW